MTTINTSVKRTSVPAFCMPLAASMSATRVLESAYAAAARTGNVPFIGVRNDAQGGASAWSPPV